MLPNTLNNHCAILDGCIAGNAQHTVMSASALFHAKKVNLVTSSLVDQTSDRVFERLFQYIPSAKHIT